MKLQNSQTGQVDNFYIDEDKICSCDRVFVYDSLTQLQDAGWEDYEEPKWLKEYWIINDLDLAPRIISKDNLNDICFDEMMKIRKQSGNYFETQEEAEKVVEKLKAWKRLKDRGFNKVFSVGLRNALCGGKTVEFKLLIDDEDSVEDIKLLFGGEE